MKKKLKRNDTAGQQRSRERKAERGRCRVCTRRATRGVYCEYHRVLYNERVLAHRAERQERGVCILCGKKVCKKSVRYCKEHFDRSSELASRRDRRVSVRGALFILFGKESMLRSKLEEKKRKLALKVDKLKFRTDLSDDELWVLENRVLISKRVPLREAGRELGISHEWVRQTELRLAENLKTYLGKGK